MDKLLGSRVKEEKNIGISLSFQGDLLYQSAGTAEGPSVAVSHTSEATGLTLLMHIPSQNVKMATTPLVTATIISLGILTLTYGFLVVSVRHLEKQVESERNQREQMRLKAMQAQINPHFLYNTLSIINWKAKYADVPDISKITTLISDFYRTALNRGEETIRLKEELRNVESYLELKHIMMDGCFTYEIRCQEGIGEERIVNFILQPLVENALIHGIAPQEGGHILVEAVKSGTDILLSVQDNGPGIPPEAAEAASGQGYGIRSINERIGILCGPGYGVTKIPLKEGARVEIRVKAAGS